MQPGLVLHTKKGFDVSARASRMSPILGLAASHPDKERCGVPTVAFLLGISVHQLVAPTVLPAVQHVSRNDRQD